MSSLSASKLRVHTGLTSLERLMLRCGVHHHGVLQSEVDDRIGWNIDGLTESLSAADCANDIAYNPALLLGPDEIRTRLDVETITVNIDGFQIEDKVVVRGGSHFQIDARAAGNRETAVFAKHVLIDDAVINAVSGIIGIDVFLGPHRNGGAPFDTGHMFVVIPVAIMVVILREYNRNTQSDHAG